MDAGALDRLDDLDREPGAWAETAVPLAFDLILAGPGDVRLSITEERPRKPRTKLYHLHRSQVDPERYLIREVGKESVRDVYEVYPDTPRCTCPGFSNHNHCRHILGLQTLASEGRLWIVPKLESQYADRNQKPNRDAACGER